MKDNEKWSILMFIIIFIFAVSEFLLLPDGVGIRLSDGLKHYCRIKPYEIMPPVIIASFGAALTHHGAIKKGIFFFFIGIAIFIGTLVYQL